MKDEGKSLPPWFRKPKPIIHTQLELFNPTIDCISAEYKVSIDELFRWYDKDWLSFNPLYKNELSEIDFYEIIFVRDVVRSGLSDACIEDLFSQLPKPFSFKHDEIAYSFSLGWVENSRHYYDAEDFGGIIEEHLEEWIDILLIEDDIEKINYTISLLKDLERKMIDISLSNATDRTVEEIEYDNSIVHGALIAPPLIQDYDYFMDCTLSDVSEDGEQGNEDWQDVLYEGEEEEYDEEDEDYYDEEDEEYEEALLEYESEVEEEIHDYRDFFAYGVLSSFDDGWFYDDYD